MGEQQFPKILIQQLSLGVNQLHRNITQAQALHGGAVLPCRFQRHQAPFLLHNGVTQCGRHFVPIAGGTGGRIGNAAGGQNHPVGRVCIHGARNARYRAVF